MNGRTVDFDTLSGNYDALRGRSRERLLPWIVETVKYAGIRTDGSVLDIGCGTGRYTELFAEFSGCVVGTDISSGMLSEAMNEGGRRVSYVRSNALSLPFCNESFDCAVMFMAVHHFSSGEMCALFQEVSRILRKGGRFVILTESHARIRRSQWRLFPGLLKIDLARFPNLGSLSAALKHAGFETGHKSVKINFGQVPTEEYIRKVAGKFISTFALMSEKEFEEGLSVFSRRLRILFPEMMPDEQDFMLVKGTKPDPSS